MTVTLPTAPAPRTHSVLVQDFGGYLTPFIGTDVQRINRLGNRWGLTVNLPPMRIEPLGRQWIAALMLGLTEGVLYRFPQVEFSTGNQAYAVKSPNFWTNPTTPSSWTRSNANYASAGVIDGWNAGTFSVAASGTSGVVIGPSQTTLAGDTATIIIFVRAGTVSKIPIGLLDGGSSWGANGDASITVSGPGTAVQITGAIFDVSGLSAGTTSIITVTRRNLAAGSVQPYLFIGTTSTSAVAGDSLILFQPYFNFTTMANSPWGLAGTPLVNGAGQAGSYLNCDGFSADYLARAAQWFSIVSGGRRYLHHAAVDRAASGGGVIAAMQITPMLRVSPADNDVLEFAQPMIEGFLQDNVKNWSVEVARTTGLSFTILEAK